MQQNKNTFGRVFTFAEQKKTKYILSVCFALAGAAFQIMPFFVAARIIKNLIFGSGNMQGYIADCSLMAFMWLMRVLFHSLSTSESHQATFTVLGNIRTNSVWKSWQKCP